MTIRSSLALSLLAMAACGGDDGGGGTPDASQQVDAKVSTVMEVTCPATTPATFMTLGTSFMPTSATVSRGAIVKFDTGADHPIIPARDGVNTDPGIMVGPSKTKCLMFTAAGTFRFECQQHSYIGTLTVN